MTSICPLKMHFSAFASAGYGFFVLSFLNRPYNFARVCFRCKVKQGIACTIELICWWIFFVLQVYKSNEYNNNFLNCNCQQMTLKQDGVHFVVCPKQGNEIAWGYCLKHCLSWRCFILNDPSRVSPHPSGANLSESQTDYASTHVH